MGKRNTYQESDDSEPLDCQMDTSKFNVTINKTPTTEKEQILSFKDQNASYTYAVDSAPDPTYGIADMGDDHLESFFSRPLNIASFEWAPTLSFYEEINPWSLYFENPRVINRINNFYMMRAKLHVKILINGNGFYFGKLLANYRPLHLSDDLTLDRGLVPVDNIAASQRPHVYIDPTDSTGGDLILPFVYPYNGLSIPLAAWREMGRLSIRELTPLKHSNGATTPITITVFAWAEDVSLSVPTNADSTALSNQCTYELLDPQADEYGTGPISRPAAITANWMGKLRNAPVIGMYARATELAASAVSGIAQIFGYSRPAVLNDIVPYRPTYVGNMANTNMPDSTTKLSLDAKQEITIDPRTMGLSGVDEMTIASIAGRESYLTSFTWTVDTAPRFAPGSFLWGSHVSPVLWAEHINGTNREFHFPACAFAALPFKHWRGTMNFRFQIVASSFHKGRLQISYDPFNRIGSQWELNTNYSRIVDIAEEKDFTVSIGWGSLHPYCEHLEPNGTVLVQPPYGPNTTDVPSVNPVNQTNGFIGVKIINSLAVPDSLVDNDVTINVFVSMGDDFEVFNPSAQSLQPWTIFPSEQLDTQSELLDCQSEMLDESVAEPSAPMNQQVDESMLASIDLTDGMSSICFGEKIVSFRQCMKRYGYSTAYGLTDTGLLIYKRTCNDFFGYRGYDPQGIHSTAALQPYNYYKTDVLHYLTPAYTCRRGALRKKIQAVNIGNFALSSIVIEDSIMRVTRTPQDDTFTIEQIPIDLSVSSSSGLTYTHTANLTNTWAGTHVTCTKGNPVLEVEFPYQQDKRFLFGKQTDFSQDLGNQGYLFEAIGRNDANTSTVWHEYTSIGEDYQLAFFTGAPVMYYALTDPLPLL